MEKMDDLEIQLSKGIDYSKSNSDLISTGLDRLQKSLAQARTGVDELVSSYSSTDLMPNSPFPKIFANCPSVKAFRKSTTGSRHLLGNSKTNNLTHLTSKADKID